MTLHVAFEQFPETVKRVLDSKVAYVSAHGGGTLATATGSTSTTVVKASIHEPLDEAKSRLTKAGMEVYEGTWTPDDTLNGEVDVADTAHIAAVSYVSSEDKPGIWVDAFPQVPTPVQVLRSMYDEFRQTGELDDISFEEFVRQANPNVVVVNPSEIEGFIRQKDPC